MTKRLLLILLLLSTLLQATPLTESSLAKLYIATFKRAPDSTGFDYWMKSGFSLEQIAQSFFDQKETKEMYPDGYSDSDFIEAIYQNLFDRSPDGAGFAYWLEALQSGRVSRDLFILATINGALGSDATLLINRAMVGLIFARAGRDDIDEAKAIITETKDTKKSVDDTLCKHTLAECKKDEDSPDDDTPPSSGGGGGGGGATPPPTNAKPVADAGDDKVDVARTIPKDINGTGTDSDGDALTYLWSIKSSTSSGGVGDGTIADTTNKDTTFTATQAGLYTLSLVVNDGTEDSDEDTMTITVTPPSTLKKTGQTTLDYSKDDGDYQIGVEHSYTRDDTNNVVTDNVTNLMWQDSSDVADSNNKKTWQEAIDYCESLDFANHQDWRLPTIDELVYITGKGKSDPTIDTGKFHNVASSRYWSATTYASSTSYAWIVHFYYGNGFNYDKPYSYFVRCVRAGQ